MTGAFAKTAFVYFSATGTTERMAKNAAKEMGADVFEIQPVHKYTAADLNWHDRKSLTTIECNDPNSRPSIANKIDIRCRSARAAALELFAERSASHYESAVPQNK